MQTGVIRQSVMLTAIALGLLTSIGAPAFAQTSAPSDTATQSAGPAGAEQVRYRFVVNHNSGKCLDVRGAATTDGAAVVQTTCDRTRRSQQWRPEPTHDNYVQLRNRGSRLCLDVKGASTANGAGLVQATCDSNHHSQHWSQNTVENRYVQLRNEPSDKCVDIRRGSTADGARAVQATCVRDRRSQHWQLLTTLPE
jgi:Ricin-type beta-trefoil lectin domain